MNNIYIYIYGRVKPDVENVVNICHRCSEPFVNICPGAVNISRGAVNMFIGAEIFLRGAGHI